jgi:threonine dehydrogenase-like Zn-dependent dehydrogenase
MKKYYVVGPRQLELREEPEPEPGPNQVLIESRVSAVSVGTEVWRYINGGHYGGEGSDCGYNTAGVVVRVGADVTGVQVGDAAFSPQPHAQLVLADAHRVVKLPTGVDFEAGAFTYLPSLGLHALRSAGYQVGENVLVIGQGIVGLLAGQVAQMVGARVAALEIDPGRRALASRAGISTVRDPSSTDRGTLFDGVGPDVVVETSQAWPGLEAAMRLARADTRVAVVGIYRSEPPEDTARQVLRGTFMDRDRFTISACASSAAATTPSTTFPPTSCAGPSAATCTTSPRRSLTTASTRLARLPTASPGTTSSPFTSTSPTAVATCSASPSAGPELCMHDCKVSVHLLR